MRAASRALAASRAARRMRAARRAAAGMPGRRWAAAGRRAMRRAGRPLEDTAQQQLAAAVRGILVAQRKAAACD